MKICTLQIKGYQQFSDTFLDFTNPTTGEPLNKICFIGRNGTGKSTILHIIDDLLIKIGSLEYNTIPYMSIKVKLKNRFIYVVKSRYSASNMIYSQEIEQIPDWFEKFTSAEGHDDLRKFKWDHKKYEIEDQLERQEIVKEIGFRNGHNDLLVYVPAESGKNTYLQIHDVPETTLDSALKLFSGIPYHQIVSHDNVGEFWRLLIYQIKRRENQREQFENEAINLSKTKRELIEEFDGSYPKILDKISDLWNNILGNAGLEFDIENASNPIQLNDNLKAYIRLKTSLKNMPYKDLSSGIRNYIFRLGHICSIYFNRVVEKGFMLVDEPENSLFPDFLFELVETYESLMVDMQGEMNTQLFMATHNPIIAAQFESYERIILEWNDEGYVNAYKGVAPAGDDPNDILIKDFRIRNLMGKKGQQVWKEYLELRKQLKSAKGIERDILVDRINKIGSEYNFEQ